MRSNRVLLAIAAAALLLIGLALQGNDQTDSGPIAATEANATVENDGSVEDGGSADVGTSVDVEAERFSELPLITEDQLPIEAIDTLILIDDGGPYPFDRDDLIFQNREGILPDRERGHYREYTVITPGLDHRGARRVVAGDDGERYYTQDHYESFLEIVWN